MQYTGDPNYEDPKQWRERDENLQRLGFSSFEEEYLKSELWASIKKRVLERDCHKCRKCYKAATFVCILQFDRATLAGEELRHLLSTCGNKACYGWAIYDKHEFSLEALLDALKQPSNRTNSVD